MRDRIEKHREALRGGGWCLEWPQPPPKGVQRERGREKRKGVKEREIREKMFIHISFIPHKGLNSTRGGRYIGV